MNYTDIALGCERLTMDTVNEYCTYFNDYAVNIAAMMLLCFVVLNNTEFLKNVLTTFVVQSEKIVEVVYSVAEYLCYMGVIAIISFGYISDNWTWKTWVILSTAIGLFVLDIGTGLIARGKK